MSEEAAVIEVTVRPGREGGRQEERAQEVELVGEGWGGRNGQLWGK